MALVYQLTNTVDTSLIQIIVLTFIVIALINWFLRLKSLPPGPLALPLIGTYKSTF